MEITLDISVFKTINEAAHENAQRHRQLPVTK
jgi:hypothetical protein